MQQAEQELNIIEISIEQAQEKVMLAKALAQLRKNNYFDILVQKKYLEDEAIRLVMLKACMGTQDEKNQKYIDQKITAIGQFNQFLLYIEQEGREAEKSIITDEAERERILEEV